jgi:hypothetical protein
MAVAMHIHNRTFRRGINDIPLRLLTGATPDLSYLRTFGCPAFVSVPRANRSKIAPSARVSIFVGYSPDSRAWLIWMPNTRVVLISRSVAFHETDRLGRFDSSMPDEWLTSPPQDCVVSSPPRVVHSPPSSAPQLPLSPREGLQVCHSDSDSTDDDVPPYSVPPSSAPYAPPLLDHPQPSALDLIPSRPSRTIRPKVRLSAADNVFPTHGYQPSAALLAGDSPRDPQSSREAVSSSPDASEWLTAIKSE